MEEVAVECSQVYQYLPGGQCQPLFKPAPPEYGGGMLNSKPQCLGKT